MSSEVVSQVVTLSLSC